MCMNMMQYLTFSIKLYTFYEIIKAAAYDIFFIIIIFMLLLLTYALIGFLLFGVTDSNFSTFGESILTLFLFLTGAKSTFQIDTTSVTILHFYGVSFILINIILLNIIVAIIGTHYFEFYVLQGANKNNMLKVILRYIVDRRKSKGSTKNTTWYQKIVNKLFDELDQWLTVVADEDIDQKQAEKPHVYKQYEHDVALPPGFLQL